jgi:hypothetical protein
MTGPVRCRIIPHSPSSSPLIARKTCYNSLFFYILDITRLYSTAYRQNHAIAMKTGILGGGGRGYSGIRLSPNSEPNPCGLRLET